MVFISVLISLYGRVLFAIRDTICRPRVLRDCCCCYCTLHVSRACLRYFGPHHPVHPAATSPSFEIVTAIIFICNSQWKCRGPVRFILDVDRGQNEFRLILYLLRHHAFVVRYPGGFFYFFFLSPSLIIVPPYFVPVRGKNIILFLHTSYSLLLFYFTSRNKRKYISSPPFGWLSLVSDLSLSVDVMRPNDTYINTLQLCRWV